MKDHYIIINWNSKAEGIIKQIKSPDLDERGIIIITESNKLDHLNEIDEYKSIRILKGDPTDEIILKNANINKAYSIIILANENKSDISDAKAILILLSILKLCKDKPISMIAEILEPRNVAMVKDIVEREKGNVEIISTKHLGEKLLSQAIVSPGLSKIYEDLLTFDENAHSHSKEIYRFQLPLKLKEHSFKKLLEYALKSSQENINIIPIAVSRKDEIFINPCDGNDMLQLSDCDYYFAIAARQTDLKAFNNYVEKQNGI